MRSQTFNLSKIVAHPEDMARAFKVPHYSEIVAAKAYQLSGFKKSKFLDIAVAAACDDDYVSLRAECDELDDKSRDEKMPSQWWRCVSIDRVLSYANDNAYVYHENKWTFKYILCRAAAAVTYLFEGFFCGRFSVEQIASPSWRDIEHVTR